MGSPSVARGTATRGRVTAVAWNWWQACDGISGSFRVERVAGLPWNQWQVSPGIGGSFTVEYASAKARATALRNLAASPGLLPSQRPASSLACICPWGIPAMPVMWSRWSTKWSRRLLGSRRPPGRPSARWPAIWHSMMLPCERRCISGGFLP
jgi:hypothetical protein